MCTLVLPEDFTASLTANISTDIVRLSQKVCQIICISIGGLLSFQASPSKKYATKIVRSARFLFVCISIRTVLPYLIQNAQLSQIRNPPFLTGDYFRNEAMLHTHESNLHDLADALQWSHTFHLISRVCDCTKCAFQVHT